MFLKNCTTALILAVLGTPMFAEESVQRHWAWQTLRRPTLPELDEGIDDCWTHNPIDAFVFAKLNDVGVQPLPRADRRVLVRRVYFDLIGLPPTPQQQRSFLADDSRDAWSNLVDRLLSDPAHGERWARHWMDVWRYSDWDGYNNELRGSQRHIWRWRDWIVESLNADKGYDRMIVEMLAGDEIAPTDPDVLRATGFLARNYHNSNRDIWLDATVEHTAKAFVALTINCARCHDHKYDPVSQREYYAFRAIFEPHNVRTERLPGQSNLNKDGVARVFDAKPDEPTYLYEGGNEKMPRKDDPVAAGTPAAFATPLEYASVEVPTEAQYPFLRDFVEKEDIGAAERKLANAFQKDDADSELKEHAVAAAQEELASLRARWAADKARYGGLAEDQDEQTLDHLRRAAVVAEQVAKRANARLVLTTKQKALAKAEAEKKNVDKARKEVEEAQEILDALADGPGDDASYTPVGKAYPATSTGRRLALARWITRPNNPLTARVAVNYVWMHHFGKPLVENVFDFGLRTPDPVHRALLDWLAVELIDHDWSLKHLHRLIVNSHTFRLASFCDDVQLWQGNRQLDFENALFWRASVRRLEAEVIRDSLLAIGGNLDRTTGGPDIDFRKGESIPRRSLYFRHAYEKQMPMLVIFDAAAPTECYRRSRSIIPQQALALANGPLAVDQARWLAKQLSDTHIESEEFIRAAFATLLCRECTELELGTCLSFLSEQAELLSDVAGLTQFEGAAKSRIAPAEDAGQRARENLVHTLMNHNDFVTVR